MKVYTIKTSINDIKKEKSLIQQNWTDSISDEYQKLLDAYIEKCDKLEKELANFTNEMEWLEVVCKSIENIEQSQKNKVYVKRL